MNNARRTMNNGKTFSLNLFHYVSIRNGEQTEQTKQKTKKNSNFYEFFSNSNKKAQILSSRKPIQKVEMLTEKMDF